jgi:hypothetical protein
MKFSLESFKELHQEVTIGTSTPTATIAKVKRNCYRRLLRVLEGLIKHVHNLPILPTAKHIGSLEIVYWAYWLAQHFVLYTDILPIAYGGDAQVAPVIGPAKSRTLLEVIIQNTEGRWMMPGKRYPFPDVPDSELYDKLRVLIHLLWHHNLERFAYLICKMADHKAFVKLFTAVFERDGSLQKVAGKKAEGTIVTVCPEPLFVEFDKSLGNFDTVLTLWLITHHIEPELHEWIKAELKELCEYWALFTKCLRVPFETHMPWGQYCDVSRSLTLFKGLIEKDQRIGG